MSSSALTKIAFIGTGLMGAPMAQRLLATGYSVRVWNRTPRKLERLIAAGADRVGSPAEAAGSLAQGSGRVDRIVLATRLD